MAEIKKISTELQLLDKFLDTSGDAGTSGQVLTSTGTGINWVSGGSLPGGPYLPLSAGSSYPLTGDLYIAKAANQGQLFFGTANANYEIFGGGFWGYMGYNTNGYHRFLIQGSEKMRINSSGNIGIGTTNPGSKLEVKTSGTNTTVELDNSDTDYTVIQYNAQGATKGFSGFNAGFMLFGGEAGVTTRLQAGGSYAATILTNGNVGIGTTSPDSLLELENSPAAQTKSRLLHIDNNPINNQGSGYIEISSGSNNQAKTQIEQVSSGGFGLLGNQYIDTNIINRGLSSSAYGNINFATGSSSSSTSIVMTIGGGSQKGNVGIGTTSPGAILHVKGSTDSTEVIIDTNDNAIGDSAFIKFNGARAQVGWIDAAVTLTDGGGNKDIKLKVNTGSIFLQTNNTSRLTVADGGNVGIGTTSPIDELHVEGVIQSKKQLLPSTSGTAGWYKIGTMSGFVQGGATAVLEIAGHSGYNALNNQDYLIKLFIKTSNGSSVGPDGQKFNSWYERTGGNNNTIEFKWNNSATNDYDLYMFIPTHSLRSWYSIKKGTGTWDHVGTSASDPGANSSTVLKATGLFNILDANVGIRTANATDTLTVNGNLSIFGNKIYNGSASNSAGVSFPNSTTRIDGYSGITFHSSTTTVGSQSERMRITNAGNVGIGTTSPANKLVVSVSTAGDYATLINNTNSTNGYGLLARTASTGTSSYAFAARAGSSDIFVVRADGNVGIGTTSPGAKLDVVGKINQTTSSGGTAASFTNSDATSGYGVAIQSEGTSNTRYALILRNLDSSNVYGGVSTMTNQVGFWGIGASPTGTLGSRLTVGGNASIGSGYKANSAPTNGLIVEGNVGIGATSPTNKLHIQGSQATVYSSTDSGGQASAGTTINNTNTAGSTNNFSQLLFTVGTNNNSVSRIVAIRSGSDASDLAFVGKSAAGVAEYMRIKSGGNVGIGINNPSALLEVRKGSISGQIAKFSAINPHVVIESSTAGNAVLHLKPNTTGSKSGQFKVTAGNGYNFRWSNDASGTAETAYMDLDTSTTGGGDLTVKGDVIAYGSPSDRKYKENIKPIESALDKAMQLQGVTFDWKDSESILEIKEDIGFIAQDVQEVLPELVRDNGKGNLSLRYQGVTPILLEAIKELKAEIEELKLNNCNCNK